MMTVGMTATDRMLLTVALLSVAAVASAQEQLGEAIVATDDLGVSILMPGEVMPGEGWDSSSRPNPLHDPSSTPGSVDESRESAAWDASSGYAMATCADPGGGCANPCQDGQCHSDCHSGGLGDAPGLFQFLGHSKSACWTLRSEALLLWRNAPSSRPIYSTIEPATGGLGPTALNANQLNSDVLAAPRLSLFRTDCDGRTLETTYLYAGNFYAERTLPYARNGYATSPPGIYGNSLGPQSIQVDAAQATLLGQLQSLEFNSRHSFGLGSCQFLMGARWLQWNETLSMQDQVLAPPAIPGRDYYQTRCFNNLWGGQIGLDSLLLGSAGMSRIEGIVKAGAYYNHAGQISSARYVTTAPSGDWFNQARADGPAAASFVGEVGVTAVLPLSANCDFRCGYFGLWLTNLAQPTRQLSGQTIDQTTAIASLDTAGYMMLQGLSLGLESRW